MWIWFAYLRAPDQRLTDTLCDRRMGNASSTLKREASQVESLSGHGYG